MLARTVALLSVVFIACGGGVIQRTDAPPPPPKGAGAVKVEVKPNDASIYVDGLYLGTAGRYLDGWIPVALGTRRLSVKAQGHYTAYMVIKVSTAPTVLSVNLVPRPEIGE